MPASSPTRLLLTFVLCATISAAGQPPPAATEDQTMWSGEVAVDTPLTVPAGATLVVRPGTRISFGQGGSISVQGRLTAVGEKGNPIRFLGSTAAPTVCVSAGGEQAALTLVEVEFSRAAGGVDVHAGSVSIRSARFQGIETALRLDTKSRGELADVVFEESGTALTVTNGSSIEARNLTFRRDNTGLLVLNGSKVLLEDSSFSDLGRAVVQQRVSAVNLTRCSFTRNDVALDLQNTAKGPTVSFGTFTGNRTGVSASLFSHPLIDACRFRDNEVAFSADQFSNPFLRYNVFDKNGQAIRFDKKSNGRIEANRLERNKIGVFADFSSYPLVQGNLFIDNEWHVKLGIQESIDFERQRGSGDLTREKAEDKKRTNPASASPPPPLRQGVKEVKDEVFSVAGNAWDESTLREMASGPEANITRFWDGRDQPPVTYEGFGDTRYAVDVISFLPYAEGNTVAAGPEAWKVYAPTRQSADTAAPSRRFPEGTGERSP